MQQQNAEKKTYQTVEMYPCYVFKCKYCRIFQVFYSDHLPKRGTVSSRNWFVTLLATFLGKLNILFDCHLFVTFYHLKHVILCYF